MKHICLHVDPGTHDYGSVGNADGLVGFPTDMTLYSYSFFSITAWAQGSDKTWVKMLVHMQITQASSLM